MMGTRPKAKEIARTRSSVDAGINTRRSRCAYNREQTNVSLRGAHGGRSNSKDLLDSLSGEGELGDDLLVGESSKKPMRPGMNADFVAAHVLFD